MAEAAVGTGGALVPVPVAAEIIDLLRARAVAFRAGARTVPMGSQTLKFARLTTSPRALGASKTPRSWRTSPVSTP
jgi:hypothetical protein